MTAKIDIVKEINRGWELFKDKDNMILLILSALVATVVSFVSLTVLAGPMFAGYVRIVKRLIDKDPVKPQVGDLLKGMDKFKDTFILIISFIVILAIAYTIACYIPVLKHVLRPVVGLVGAVGAPLLTIALFHIVFGNMTFKDAVKKIGDDISSESFWMLALAIFIGNAISGICCVVVFVTGAIGACIQVYAYRSAYGNDPSAIPVTPETPEPPPAN
jgi:hypothetical protein